MRLNFSGVDADRLREGVRRIGEVVHEQVDLLGSLTGRRPGAVARPTAPAATPDGLRVPDPALADVLHLPPRRDDDATTRRSSS
jgi:2-aminoadipate transaminase